MKIAEALISKADQKERLYQLKERLMVNCKIQEGDEPSEDPKDLLREIESVLENYEEMTRRITKTNSKTNFSGETTLADALSKKEIIKLEHKMLSEVLKESSVSENRYSRSEIKFISTLDIKALRKKIDNLAKEYRTLDTEIQKINWQTELLD